MWIMTKRAGFISAIQDADNPDYLIVRARRITDLTELAGPAVRYTPGGDYAWRCTVPRDVFAAFLSREVARLDYTNVKDALGEDDPPLHDAMLDVWFAMRKLQADVEPPAWDDDPLLDSDALNPQGRLGARRVAARSRKAARRRG